MTSSALKLTHNNAITKDSSVSWREDSDCKEWRSGLEKRLKDVFTWRSAWESHIKKERGKRTQVASKYQLPKWDKERDQKWNSHITLGVWCGDGWRVLRGDDKTYLKGGCWLEVWVSGMHMTYIWWESAKSYNSRIFSCKEVLMWHGIVNVTWEWSDMNNAEQKVISRSRVAQQPAYAGS